MKNLLCAALLAVAPAVISAQTSISADGVIESKSGGFKFPDGTVQATAGGAGSAPVENTGLQGCWDASGNPISCSGTGQDGELQRGVDWPTPRFTDHLDGTVTDNLTGLIWLKNANCFGTRTWEQALSDANGLMTGTCGLSDDSMATAWRLPNIKELLSLVDYSQFDPPLPPGHPFGGVQSSFYWSSSTTSSVTDRDLAWLVFMNIGGDATTLPKSLSHSVWPVRGGQ